MEEIVNNEAMAQMLHYINNEMSDCESTKFTTVLLTRHYDKSLLNLISGKFPLKARRNVDITAQEFFDSPNSVCMLRIINGKLVLGEEERTDSGDIVYTTPLYRFDIMNSTPKDIKNKTYENKHHKNMCIHTIEGMLTYHETVKKLRSKADKEMLTRIVVGASDPIFVIDGKSIFNRYMLITQDIIDSGFTHYYGYMRPDNEYGNLDFKKPLYAGDYLVATVQEDGLIFADAITEYEFKLRFTTK